MDLANGDIRAMVELLDMVFSMAKSSLVPFFGLQQNDPPPPPTPPQAL